MRYRQNVHLNKKTRVITIILTIVTLYFDHFDFNKNPPGINVLKLFVLSGNNRQY